jgi:glutathione S-transferase
LITLHQFVPTFGLPNASPFCMKLETWLRMAQLPYVAPRMTLAELRKAPKGKMPYIVDHGRVLSDSTFIIDYLKAAYGDRLDAWLNAEQHAVALAFQRLLEENLYWALVYSRWIEPAGWEQTRVAFFADLPRPLKWVVPPLVRRGMRQELHGQGMGRHSPQEVYSIGQRDITALADFLGNKLFFMGDAPCTLDAAAYGFLANLLWAPVDSPLKQHARTYPQLEAHCQRMRKRYYA